MPNKKRKNRTISQIAIEPPVADGLPEAKKLHLLQLAPETSQVSDSFSDKYRLPHEVEDHWQLRRLFIEKNYHILPEAELACLAQVFMNIELLHCRYPPETMKWVAELSEGITTEYRRGRSTMLQRTFVAASRAAALKVQQKAPDLNENSTDSSLHVCSNNELNQKADPFEPRFRPNNLEEVLRNIIVINNSFHATATAFKNFTESCGWKMEATVSVDRNENVAYVMVGGFELTRVIGTADAKSKALSKKAKTAALKFLTKHCYTLHTKKNPTQIGGVSVIAKTNSDSTVEEKKTADSMLDTSNVGFKLMRKLGWKGGGLGVRGEGIIDPLKAELKIGRKGLGGTKPTKHWSSEVMKQLRALRDGTLRRHLVFSTEFTNSDRSTIHQMAHKLRLKTRSFGNKTTGNRKLVAYANDLTPHEKLKKVLIEKDPFYCEMYEVRSPIK